MNRVKKIKVHREGTGILLSVLAIFLIVNTSLFYFGANKTLTYSVLVVTLVLFLIILNFFRSPHRCFLFDAEGLVIAPADGTIVAIEEVEENEYFRDKRMLLRLDHKNSFFQNNFAIN